MTIKQQGGIFGRNPTFNEVNVEGGLSVDGSSYTNFKENGSDIGSVFVTGDKIGIGTLNNGIAFDQSSNIILPFNPQTLLKRDGELDLGYAAGKFKDLYLSGNVIVDNGKGIDFSATSGTGTSELFSDYEEGSWSPTLTTDGTDFSSVSYDARRGGSYTKIGRMVHIQLTMITDSITVGSASGNIVIGGLPFSPTTGAGGGTDQGYAALAVSYATNWTSNPPKAARVHETNDYIQLMDGGTFTAVADANTGTNDNYINISGTYITD